MKCTQWYSILLGGIFAVGCSSDADDAQPRPFIDEATAAYYIGTQSPGDVWSWALDKSQGHMMATWDYGTFDDESDDITIEGTFDALPSGFLKVVITKVTPSTPEIKTDGSAWFYALEIPGMAMVVKPEGSIKGDVIALVPEGNCAQIPGTYNYIVSAPGEQGNYDAITKEAFGYLEVTPQGSDFALSGYKFSLDCLNGGNCTDTGVINSLPTASCNGNGGVVLTESGNTVAQGQFTNGGVMMMDFGYGNGGVFALKASALATKESVVGNNFSGIAYMPKNENDKTVPVRISFFDNGLGTIVGTGFPFTNIETDEVAHEEGAVVVIDDVINGRVLGSMNFDEDADTSAMSAALLVNGNNQIMVLISYDEEEQNPFILFLAKQN